MSDFTMPEAEGSGTTWSWTVTAYRGCRCYPTWITNGKLSRLSSGPTLSNLRQNYPGQLSLSLSLSLSLAHTCSQTKKSTNRRTNKHKHTESETLTETHIAPSLTHTRTCVCACVCVCVCDKHMVEKWIFLKLYQSARSEQYCNISTETLM